MYFHRSAVPDTPFSLPVSASRDDLSHLINQLLEREGKEFDFLISGVLLRSQLGRVIEQLHINTVSEAMSHSLLPAGLTCSLHVCLSVWVDKENVIQIEYVERSPPPSLAAEFSHNDWLAAVQCTEQL